MAASDTCLFLYERYEVVPDQAYVFAAHYRDTYGEGLKRLGVEKVGFWQTSALQGRPTDFCALWELPDASFQSRISAALDTGAAGDADLQEHRNQLSPLVARREGWCVSGVGGAMNLAQIRAANLSMSSCLLVDVDTLPNRIVLYDRSLRVNFLRLLQDTGISLVGVFRPVKLSIQALVLWDLANWPAALAAYDEIAGTDAFLHWNAVAQETRTGWRSRLLEAA